MRRVPRRLKPPALAEKRRIAWVIGAFGFEHHILPARGAFQVEARRLEPIAAAHSGNADIIGAGAQVHVSGEGGRLGAVGAVQLLRMRVKADIALHLLLDGRLEDEAHGGRIEGECKPRLPQPRYVRIGFAGPAAQLLQSLAGLGAQQGRGEAQQIGHRYEDGLFGRDADRQIAEIERPVMQRHSHVENASGRVDIRGWRPGGRCARGRCQPDQRQSERQAQAEAP